MKFMSSVKIQTRGFKIKITALMGLATYSDIDSECLEARVLGKTSPKTRINSVINAVAIAIPLSPKVVRAASAASTEALILTMVLPIKIAVRNCSGFSRSAISIDAFLFPVSARCLILILFTDISAVSEPEKKAESTINIKIIDISIVIQESISNYQSP
jgi:hypothetical protein